VVVGVDEARNKVDYCLKLASLQCNSAWHDWHDWHDWHGMARLWPNEERRAKGERRKGAGLCDG
jgi:hypothetical protein